MSVEENRSVARRFFDEIVNARDDAATNALLAPDLVFHDPNAPGGTLHGRDGFKAFRAALVAAFPDFNMTVEDEITEGDKAVVRWTSRGTHRGDFYGLPPSGRQFAVPGVDIFALDGGQIREVWVALDALGMMQQLGATPSPAKSHLDRSLHLPAVSPTHRDPETPTRSGPGRRDGAGVTTPARLSRCLL
jgi:steroid delta-isomerase-like uncharacterized protein